MEAASVAERLNKLREERIAREKARIEKLRELNLKKYNKNEHQRSISNLSLSKSKTDIANPTKTNTTGSVKNHMHMNGGFKRPTTVPTVGQKVPNNKENKTINVMKTNPTTNVIKKEIVQKVTVDKAKYSSGKIEEIKKDKTLNSTGMTNVKPTSSKTERPTISEKIPVAKAVKIDDNKVNSNKSMVRKSMAPKTDIPKPLPRKSLPASNFKTNPNAESVFDRLYKPKPVAKKEVDNVQKLHSDTNYLRKLIKDSGLIMNKRQTVFDVKPKKVVPVRRSISAVHFKRISKNEIGNCIHKWSSIGEKLDKVHLQDINEDENVKGDKVISAIKSERKKVKFQTPVPLNFNTPRPDEMQSKLQSWLQKRGKNIESYHHLQCFGIHHLTQKNLKPFEPPKLDFDDENKENIALESDSDDDSYTENMNEKETVPELDKWRQASFVSDSGEMNESCNTTMTSGEVMHVHHVDELLTGALNDLTELLREGFDWEQCARWLRSIRERFPSAPDNAAYWECRAALEERRGDLPASVQCWEEAIAKGTERSVVEANLDQLLDKFMQLKISPNSGKRRQADPKMVDVKNVFKSTIIRFAVQQAKLRKSMQNEPPKYTVTPVRRSARLSAHWSSKRTPLQICSSVRQAGEIVQPLQFIPNSQLSGTP
ncbi:uncharacterized protein LOC106131008 [Amyelois transitella]|uniref:uncharacterized protein LOC106131008 n=1 Tax=Amyelois transitella TaxID=680683 RepID=UPI00067C419A|nr:uncharacterized protein LOC106131008 [Amyelois transitella]XP_013185438.1 uncharacterized protein LOC106131008 [Amyelois transitella]XP_060809004.1 uncharacterized protein LOC106131008 [Amyelois transitella]XP_060809005.1 uncharacterized protein LOC106131008 [Amyelois transitella]XP_060809006.1 uncharacterized protein LOC106131008 [Amyelois transitella]XP_060809007.1 uncharacterized protein LOC106131008 [Amyelois transitella]